MNRGEVWWVEEPGRGRRPFLVLTRQAVIPMINKITGVPATKRIRGIPSEVLLSTDDGMPADCVLNFDNLTVLRGGGGRPGGACGGGDQESAVGVAAAGRRHTAVLEADAAAGDRPAGAVVGEGETTDGRVAALEAGGGRGPAMPAVPAGQDLPGLVADQSQKGALPPAASGTWPYRSSSEASGTYRGVQVVPPSVVT